MKILIELPEWQYKEIRGDKGISEGVMINAICAIRHGKLVEQEPVLDKCRTEEAKAHPMNENIAKGFEEFTKMMFKQGQAEREEK